MAITLNHTIVPARDKETSARFFAQIFGLKYDGPMSHFAPVRVNGELTLDFDDADSFEVHHYAFHVSDESSTPFSSACKKRAFPGAVTLGVWRIAN
jgi:catechol 2,3-dioxygenase-like lactoylglutathione lyase family enzyme